MSSISHTCTLVKRVCAPRLATARVLIAAFLLVPLSSVGQIVGKTAVSDQSLARRAAFALNTTPDKVIISERHVDEDNEWRINFMAERDGKKFQCYLGAAAGAVSDALCAGMDGSMEGGRCDPLSKAAGRC